ncbi:MAG: TonB-dependent receptor plug domain-containing protein [Gemmatimonadaceae bacterium]
MKPFSRFALALTLANVANTRLGAQANDSSQHLETVVVSASKVPKPAAALTQAVTVIDGADLRARGVTRVIDALREVPGAELVQNGSHGAVASLFLRGGESRYTKVLIDGVPVNATGGFFDFSHLTTDNIDRIEIVRGPASVLYGADAVSGIIQIFTRRRVGSEAALSARGGTYHSFDVSGDIAGGDTHAFSLGAGRHSTDGVLPFNNQYKNGTLSSAITLLHGAQGEANISVRYTAAEFHYPTDFAGQVVDTNSYRTQHRLTVGFDAVRNLSPTVQGRLLAGSNDVNDLTEDIATPFGGTTPLHSAYRSRGYRRNAEARTSFFLPLATATLGASYEREHESSFNAAAPVGTPLTQTDAFDAARHNLAYYAEVIGDLRDRVSYTLSGRVDENSDYHRFGTYRVGVVAALQRNLRVRASVSTAFNAPAFNQVRPTLFTVGSPDLRPEQIRSAEVGTSFGGDAFRVGANYFWQRFGDLIQFVSGGPPDFRGSYANLTAARSDGYEAELHVNGWSKLQGSASYTIVNPHVTKIASAYGGSDQAGDALLRRASHSGSATIAYTNPRVLSLGAAMSYVGKRPDLDFAQFPSPRLTLPAYAKLDLSLQVPLSRIQLRAMSLETRVENVFNRRYEDVLHFPAPGRTVLVGGRISSRL